MPTYLSHKGKIMQAIANLVLDGQPKDMAQAEVAVREDFRSNDTDVYAGASVIDLGEQYSEGTIGTQDVGYLVGIVFAKFRTRDATLSDDTLQLWYENFRRSTIDMRLGVDLADDSKPAEHVMIVQQGKNLTNPKLWPNYLLRQIVVAVWQRELNADIAGVET